MPIAGCRSSASPAVVACALSDALVFSSLWVGMAAGALCWAASLAMGLTPTVWAMAMAATGTFVVYNIDHLRDLERDRATTPVRSAFVAAHLVSLSALTSVAALGALAAASRMGWRAALLLAPILAVGLAHRRLKRLAHAKAIYVTAAWLAVVVGLPAVLSPAATRIGWVATILGSALLANAIASNVRDREAGARRFGTQRALWAARAVAGVGALLAAAAAPIAVRPLSWVPAMTLAALVRFRLDERYGLLVVDGALVVGAGAAIVSLAP